MGQKPRVLIVEDDEPIRMMLTKVVERLDFGVDQAADGGEAIDLIEHNGYAAIILDLMMPRVDGFTVLDHLRREQPETLDTTIVATAIPLAEVARRFPHRVYRLHSKPFEMASLIDDIRSCVQQHR
ncbi:MAG TPA: response regulator [Thermoanaerobaculia bacterium]|nr:response regulator [Thermoanaerobaculia bacterium]